MVVFDDADLESAANGILLSIFSATGQSCVAASRLFLHERIREEMLERVAEKAKAIRIGDPLDDESQMGPLATLAQLENIRRRYAITENGGRLVHGGKQPNGLDNGWYYEPTIVDCPNQDLKVVRNELFGPVLSALSFSDEAEVIKANDTRFGLQQAFLPAMWEKPFELPSRFGPALFG